MDLATCSDTRLHWLDSALNRLERWEAPFLHATGEDVLDKAVALELLGYLEQYPSWESKKGDWYFYESAGNMAKPLRSSGLDWIVGPETIDVISEHLARIFQKPIKPGIFQVEAHRMSAGQWIGPHNDAPEQGRRTHRFVVTLSRSEVCGGELVLIGDKDKGHVPVEIRSRHSSAIAMEFSRKSFHRVEPVKEGVRYSLVFSFWAQEV
jgi:hypothetical protein